MINLYATTNGSKTGGCVIKLNKEWFKEDEETIKEECVDLGISPVVQWCFIKGANITCHKHRTCSNIKNAFIMSLDNFEQFYKSYFKGAKRLNKIEKSDDDTILYEYPFGVSSGATFKFDTKTTVEISALLSPGTNYIKSNLLSKHVLTIQCKALSLPQITSIFYDDETSCVVIHSVTPCQLFNEVFAVNENIKNPITIVEKLDDYAMVQVEYIKIKDAIFPSVAALASRTQFMAYVNNAVEVENDYLIGKYNVPSNIIPRNGDIKSYMKDLKEVKDTEELRYSRFVFFYVKKIKVEQFVQMLKHFVGKLELQIEIQVKMQLQADECCPMNTYPHMYCKEDTKSTCVILKPTMFKNDNLSQFYKMIIKYKPLDCRIHLGGMPVEDFVQTYDNCIEVDENKQAIYDVHGCAKGNRVFGKNWWDYMSSGCVVYLKIKVKNVKCFRMCGVEFREKTLMPWTVNALHTSDSDDEAKLNNSVLFKGTQFLILNEYDIKEEIEEMHSEESVVEVPIECDASQNASLKVEKKKKKKKELDSSEPKKTKKTKRLCATANTFI